jgi:hypothetical protein
MKLIFEDHNEHDAFTQSADAVLAFSNLATALRSEPTTVCADCAIDPDDDAADENGERMEHYVRSSDGTLEVRDAE